ncbi:MAG: MBL fold metallo-hydrolase [Candidatus Nealsonbacteria bacterium]|nr:MBL fold metallo-hydrolase [Candidatus Nealsonbacteria bacterium]
MYKENRIIPALIILFCLNVLAWLTVFDLNKYGSLEVDFFDIGQGDAIFIETSDNHQILIDGGPGSVVLEKLGAEMPFWDRTIDLIILTHPHEDHVSGLIKVLENYEVENVLWTGISMETAIFKKWQEAIKEAKIYTAQSGQMVIADKMVLEIIYPFESLENREVKNIDDTSIVSRLVFGDNSFLFTGDAFQSVEKQMVERGIYLSSGILKVGHHGSKTSSSQEFIEKVLPEMAVISAGKDNKYGHPNQETLATLEKYGIRIFRTDQQGDIKIICNGKNYAVSNF